MSCTLDYIYHFSHRLQQRTLLTDIAACIFKKSCKAHAIRFTTQALLAEAGEGARHREGVQRRDALRRTTSPATLRGCCSPPRTAAPFARVPSSDAASTTPPTPMGCTSSCARRCSAGAARSRAPQRARCAVPCSAPPRAPRALRSRSTSPSVAATPPTSPPRRPPGPRSWPAQRRPASQERWVACVSLSAGMCAGSLPNSVSRKVRFSCKKQLYLQPPFITFVTHRRVSFPDLVHSCHAQRCV